MGRQMDFVSLTQSLTDFVGFPEIRNLIVTLLLVLSASSLSNASTYDIPLTTTLIRNESPTSEVCGWNQKTYANAEVARSDSTSGGIMHCAACGACSNAHDVQILNATRNTLTGTATRCAVLGLLLGDGAAQNCMQKNVMFTAACEQCWVTNIRCTIRSCLFTCIATWLAGGNGSNTRQGGASGVWNPCLACDEEKCGPAFKQCAGANRRRAGIVTDISRDTGELCKTVDPPPPSLRK